MAHERLGKKEILEKFIIRADYGTRNVFPYGAGATIVLSKVSCESYDGDSWSIFGIHRNQERGIHAETKLVQLIERISGNAGAINIELIQNFSPCNDIANDAFCAKKIADYKKEMESQRKQINISITFANFYRTVVYYGNDEYRAEQNRKGLRLLRDNGVQLRLLCGEEWIEFLNDDKIVSLSEDDKEICRRRAVSDKRREREDFDMKHYMEILCTLDAIDQRRIERGLARLRVSDPPARHNSMAHERLEGEEIQRKFIISEENAQLSLDFPIDKAGAEVVLSKVSIYYPSDSLSMVTIHSNDRNQHAETKLLQLLRGISENAREINIEIIQNFSPCNDEANGQFCAQKLADYKNWMKRQGTKIDISITFANFYRTVVIFGNDENRAERNSEGLRLLYDNGVQLRLLCGQEGWRKFLNDDLFVNLSAEERERCWNLAVSAARHTEEKFNRTHFWEILKLG